MSQPTRRHAPADVRRAEILAACRRLFADRRYTALSTADIAEATGVSWALIAHYFGDKAGLYRAVLESIAGSARQPDVIEGTLEERVGALVEHGLTTISHSRSSWLAVVAGAELEQPEGIAEIVESGRERAVDYALAALGDVLSHLPVEHARAVARLAISMIETGAQEWLIRSRVSREEAAAMLTASIVAVAVAAGTALAGGSSDVE